MESRIKATEDDVAALPKLSEERGKAIAAGKKPALDAAIKGLVDYKPPIQNRTFAATTAIFVSLSHVLKIPSSNIW